jgi:hypothetical protein
MGAYEYVDPAPTTLTAVSGTGTYGGTATLTATLSSNGSLLNGESVAFTLNGVNAGSATTGSDGVATLTGVDLSGYTAGTYTDYVSTTFSDGATYASSGPTTGDLTVGRANQTITVTQAAPSSATNTSTFTVAATSDSNLTVSYGSAGGCTNSGADYTMTSATTDCTVTFDQAGDDNYNAAPQVIETVTASGDPTLSYVASGVVHRAGRQLTVRWQMQTSKGVVGFHLYGGTRLLNRSLIPVHAGSRYRFTARYAGTGSVHLGVVLAAGQEVRIALR